MMDKNTPNSEMAASQPEVNQAEIDQLLREMDGNWGVDVIETVIDTPYLMVTTDNGLEMGDLYGGEFFTATERVVETLPESQLIDAMWLEDSQPLAILDSDQFPDLGLNSFDRFLVEGMDAPAAPTIDAVNLAQSTAPAPDTASEISDAPQSDPENSKKSKFYVPPSRAGTRLRF